MKNFQKHEFECNPVTKTPKTGMGFGRFFLEQETCQYFFFFILVTFIPYYIYYICNVSDFYTKAMVLCKSCKKNYIGWISISADNRGLNISTEENI